jgi:hypothetical protein
MVQEVFERLLKRGDVATLEHLGGYVFQTASSVLSLLEPRTLVSRPADSISGSCEQSVGIEHRQFRGDDCIAGVCAWIAPGRSGCSFPEIEDQARACPTRLPMRRRSPPELVRRRLGGGVYHIRDLWFDNEEMPL